ncbi:DUF2207 domain-containing protein [Sporolactobacillus sp. KGMB 08714]|uniref:DUF2207 domain-containing protein n=1 Tax=Sporolactobacillus sp. KGMB 08714 TaxID=3064704 RepID=UPI002FBD99E0
MKKGRIFPVLFLLILLLVSGCSGSGENKTFRINQVAIHAAVRPDGSMQVKELYDYTFHGSFNGTTRSINSDITGFKAYLISKNGDFFQPDESNLLKTSLEDHTYKIYTRSVNETKKILYVYTVKNVVSKSRDAAFINYSFFDHDNRTDLQHLSIHYQFPGTLNNQVNAYLYDYSGQAVLTKQQNYYAYTINRLPAGESTETHFLLPSAYFPQKSTDHDIDRYMALKKNEDAFQQRLVHRKGYVAAAKRLLNDLTWILFLVSAVWLLIRRLRRPAGPSDIDLHFLEKMDPLYAHYLDHRLRFSNDAIIAGLLSLVRKNIADMAVVPIHEKYKKDKDFPEKTIRFTRKQQTVKLTKAENYLINWLFTSKYDGKAGFTLDQIYGPTGKEKKSGKVLAIYQKKAERFKSKLTVWKDLLKKEAPFSRDLFQPKMKFFPLIALIFTGGIFVFANCLWRIDATQSKTVTGLNMVLAGLLIAAFVIYFISPRWKAGFYVFFAAAFFELMSLHDPDLKVAASLFILAASILFGFFPSKKWRPDKAAERRMLKKWKEDISRPHTEPSVTQAQLDHLFALSVSLNVGQSFIYGYKNLMKPSMTAPWMEQADVTAASFYPSCFLYYFAATDPAASGDTGSGTSFGGGPSSGGGGAGAF